MRNGATTSTKNDIDDKILNVIKNSDCPISTNEIVSKTDVTWHTVNDHCLRLALSGKLKMHKIGNTNAWVFNNEK